MIVLLRSFNVMARICVFLIVMLWGCNAGLPEEQRKALREEMESREVKKVSEHEIFRKALEMGRAMAKEVGDTLSPGVTHKYKAEIKTVDVADTLELSETELKVLNAYLYAPVPGELEDNIQKEGDKHLIYSKPILNSSGDSLQQLVFIRMLKKDVVLSL